MLLIQEARDNATVVLSQAFFIIEAVICLSRWGCWSI